MVTAVRQSSANLQIKQPEERVKLDELTRQIQVFEHPEIAEAALQEAAQTAETLFFSLNDQDQRSAYRFFQAVIEHGDNREFQAIVPFFQNGSEGRERSYRFQFHSLIEKLTSNTYRFKEGKKVALQTIINESTSADYRGRNLALSNLTRLLIITRCESWQEAELAAATQVACTILEHPYKLGCNEFETYGYALSLLTILAEHHLVVVGAGLIQIVENLKTHPSPYVQRSAKELSNILNAKIDPAKALLPSEETMQKVEMLLEENPSSITEHADLFWGLFCKQARLTQFSGENYIGWAKEAVEKLRPFFQRQTSFYTLSDTQEGFLIPGDARRPIDLTNRSRNTLHGGTKGDFEPGVFDREVKPYLALLAKALGVEFRSKEAPITFIIASGCMTYIDMRGFYTYTKRQNATLFEFEAGQLEERKFQQEEMKSQEDDWPDDMKRQ